METKQALAILKETRNALDVIEGVLRVHTTPLNDRDEMCFVQSIDQLADAAVNLNKWSSSKLTS
jgi:hypothetical protein